MKTSPIFAALLFAPALLFAEPSPVPPPAGPPTAASEKLGNPVLRRWIKQKFDSDQDGKLSETEREAAKAAFRKGSALRARLLEKFDANHDSKLNQAERENAKAAWAARRGVKAKTDSRDQAGKKAAFLRRFVLEKFDTDKNGQLSEAERAEVREAHQNRRGL